MHYDLNHYHLMVKYNGYGFEISEVFRHSNRVRNITAATVAEIKRSIRDRLEDKIKDNLFYLTWKGRKLEPDTLKLRDIEVDGERLQMHVPNAKTPIVVHLGNGDEVPSVVPDIASASDDENPDYNNAGRQIQELEKKQQEERENKRNMQNELNRQNQLKLELYYAEQRAKNLEKKRLREAAAAASEGKGKGKGKRSKKRPIKRKPRSRTNKISI
jgi:hypothetical protein